MHNEKAFIGLPLYFLNEIPVVPPTIEDIIKENFWEYLRILTISQEDLDDEFAELAAEKELEVWTPFQYLMLRAHEEPGVLVLLESAIEFFTKVKPTILPTQMTIFLGSVEDYLLRERPIEFMPKLVDTNFLDFQNLVREACGSRPVLAPDPTLHPRAKAMLAKARERDRIKAKQQKGRTLHSLMTAVCCLGVGITPLNIKDMTYASVLNILQKYQNKERYDIDVRVLTSGFSTSKKELVHWMDSQDE